VQPYSWHPQESNGVLHAENGPQDVGEKFEWSLIGVRRILIVSKRYHSTGVRKGCTAAYCGLEVVPRK